MRKLLAILAIFSLVPTAFAGTTTLTSDIDVDFLLVGTGDTLQTDAWDITVGGGTGATAIHGFLDASALNNDSTLFTQVANGFQTHGLGDVLFTGTGKLLLTSTGAIVDSPPLTVSGALADLEINDQSLVGYWKMDEGEGTLVADSSGYGNDGTLTNSDGDEWSINPSHSGIFVNPYALDFDGSDDYMNIGDPAGGELDFGASDSFSYGFWFKSSGVNTIALNKGGTSTYYDVVIGIGGTAGNIAGRIDDGTEVDTSTWTGTNDGAWHHVMFVVDRSSNVFRIYGNGEQQGIDADISGVGSLANTGELNIGAREGATNYDGLLDDVRIYNRALSASEVPTLANGYLATGGGMYTLGNALDVDGTLTMRTGGINTSASAYNVTVSGSFLNYGGSFTGNLILDGSHHDPGSPFTLIGGDTMNNVIIGGAGTGNGLVGHWTFDEGQGTTAYDVSGNGNNGTLTNMASDDWVKTTPITGNAYALDFDGSDDYVDVGNGSSLDIGTSDMSVSAWIKASSTVNDASWRDIVTKYDNSSDNDFAFQISASSITPDVGSHAEGGLLANFNGEIIADNTAIDDGAWHHVSVTRANATTHSLYLDGTQLQSGAMSNANISGSTNWRIGRLGDNTQEFAGLIDDVRIYNRALSASEVERLAGSGTWVLGAPLSVTGSLTIANATLDASASGYTVTVSGSWINRGGFTPRTGTVSLVGGDGVYLNGDTPVSLSGSTHFYNLEMVRSNTGSLIMDYRYEQAISGSLILKGGTGKLLYLGSDLKNSAARMTLDPSGTQTVEYVDVSDNDASGGQEIVCLTDSEGCNDGGGNTNWNFGVGTRRLIIISFIEWLLSFL